MESDAVVTSVGELPTPCLLLDLDVLERNLQAQQHGKTLCPLPVGSRVRVLPNHSCLAVPNFAAYHLVRGDDVVGRWAIFRGRP